MKRMVVISLIALATIGLFAANQTLLLAKVPPMTGNSSVVSGKSSTAAVETMSMANQLYETGQLAQAAQAYEQLASQGFADSALFYNLGNAYFKQQDYGRAILSYRRAQQLAPRDVDIEANLNLARALRVDQLEAADGGGLLNRVGLAAQKLFSVNELAMIALGAWILFVLLLIVFSSAKRGSVWRRGLQYVLVATAIVLLLGISALGSSLFVADSQSEGVIVAAEVDVSSGPGSQYVTEFALHSGAEVHLVETRGSWVRLALPGDELEGWVPVAAVEAVSG